MFILVYISRWWFDSHLLCPTLLGEMIQFDYTINFCTILHIGGYKHLATRFGDLIFHDVKLQRRQCRTGSSGAWIRSGGRAQRCSDLVFFLGIGLVARGWWWTWSMQGLFLDSKQGPKPQLIMDLNFFWGQKELFILSVRILVSTCGTVCICIYINTCIGTKFRVKKHVLPHT